MALGLPWVSAERIVVTVPIRTLNKNAREHFRVKAKRVAAERATVRVCLNAAALKCPWAPPLLVTLTRLSASHMDSDNVVGALAHCRDEIAAWLGIDDRHDDLVEYRYAAERCARGQFSVRIQIEPKRC